MDMKVLGLLRGNSQSDRLRLKLPFYVNATAGHPWRWIQQEREDLLEVLYSESAILVLERFYVTPSNLPDTLSLVTGRDSKLVIFDTDDDFTSVAPLNPASGMITEDVVEGTKKLIAACHAVTSTTPYLAARLANINRRSYVLPNCLDMRHWNKIYAMPREEGPLRIGWFGSESHQEDLEILEEVWPVVARLRPQVKFVLGGSWTFLLERKLGNRMESMGWVSLEEYPGIVHHIDIGCLPLQDTEFNRTKSNLKWLEFGALGIPCVASPVGPYAMLRGEVDVLHARNKKQWVQGLLRLIDDTELRRRIGMNARDVVVSKYDIRNRATLWLHTYEKVWHEVFPLAQYRPYGVWV